MFLRVCKHRKNSLCGSYERHDYTKKEKVKVNKSSWVTHLASHHYNKQNRNKNKKKITALSIGYYSITRRIQLPNILKANSTFFFFFKVFFISKHCRSLSPQVTENGVYQMQRLYTILKEHGGKLIGSFFSFWFGFIRIPPDDIRGKGKGKEKNQNNFEKPS